MPPPDKRVPVARHGALTVHVNGDEVLLHDRERGRMHVLNPTAFFVFERCDGERSIHDLARTLAAASNPDEVPDEDVAALVEAMLREGLVELVEAPNEISSEKPRSPRAGRKRPPPRRAKRP